MQRFVTSDDPCLANRSSVNSMDVTQQLNVLFESLVTKEFE